MKCALIVMSKIPIGGFTKTRLMGKLSKEECAALHSACLYDICSLLSKMGWPAYFSYTGVSTTGANVSKEILEQRCNLPQGLLKPFILLEQQGNDLGERMLNSLSQVLEQHPAAIILGSDLPQLEVKTLQEAAKLLEENDIVLGPCSDGGYYLLGVHHPYPFIFNNMLWGSNQVLRITSKRVKEHNLKLALLDRDRDLDRWGDLLFFIEQGKVKKRLLRLHSYRYISNLKVIKEALKRGNLNENTDKANLQQSSGWGSS
jgi:hypothetical protein